MDRQKVWVKRKRYVTLPTGRRIAYVESGRGKPQALVLLHGFTDSSRSYSLLEPYLTGYHLIILDLPGHGATPVSNGGATLAGAAEDINAFISCLKLNSVILVGHSFGAMVACCACSKALVPYRGLVCINGTAHSNQGKDRLLYNEISNLPDPVDPAADFFQHWHMTTIAMEPDFVLHLRQEAADIPKSQWLNTLSEIEAADLRELPIPKNTSCAVIYGEPDNLFDETHQQGLMTLLHCATLDRIPDSGHNPHWDNPKKVAEIITTFAKAMQPSL